MEPRKKMVADVDGVDYPEDSTQRVNDGREALRSAGVREHGM